MYEVRFTQSAGQVDGSELRSEATLLSQNSELMRFLDERFAEKATITLEELETEAS